MNWPNNNNNNNNVLSVEQYFIGNLIIAFETSTSRNYVIVYVNDEDNVLIYYAVKFIHRGPQHQGEDFIFSYW